MATITVVIVILVFVVFVVASACLDAFPIEIVSPLRDVHKYYQHHFTSLILISNSTLPGGSVCDCLLGETTVTH